MTLDAVYKASYGTGVMFAQNDRVTNQWSVDEKFATMRRDVGILECYNNHIVNVTIHAYLGWLCGYHGVKEEVLRDLRMIGICLSDTLLLHDVEQLESRWKIHLQKIKRHDSAIVLTIINFVLHDLAMLAHNNSTLKWRIVSIVLNTFHVHLHEIIQTATSSTPATQATQATHITSQL